MNAEIWSESTKTEVRRQLQICYDTHDACRLSRKDFTPSHLIEISHCSSSPSGFTLRLTKDIQGSAPYAALSYCWGGDQELKTTQKTIHAHLKSISQDAIPATISDAVQVAYDLGFRYFWVDALCLIQDLRPNELHTLIAEIPQIYRHASLTIAAYSSEKADQGFLHRRNIRNIPTESSTSGDLSEHQILIKRLHGRSGLAMMRFYKHASESSGFVGPIDRRGWTLQERILSRRYLIFSDSVTQWTCNKCITQNRHPTDGGSEWWLRCSGVPHFSVQRMLDNQIRLWKEGERNNQNSKKNFHHLWRALVQVYTNRHLGSLGDRPIAISALADELGSREDYAAGLWLSNLATDLCWGISRFPSINKPVTTYYAPSWSWWSVSKAISWTESPWRYADPRFRLLLYRTQLAHPSAPFGYLRNAILRVQVRCGSVTVGFDPDRGTPWNWSTYYTLNYDSSKRGIGQIFITIDRPILFRKGEEISARLIVLVVGKDRRPKEGLIIAAHTSSTDERNEQNEIYYRLGCFKQPGEGIDYGPIDSADNERFTKWLEEQPVETITLV